MDYNKKYLKYKSKYNEMKGGQIGGGELLFCNKEWGRYVGGIRNII